MMPDKNDSLPLREALFELTLTPACTTDSEGDADLIAWLQTLPHGQRSQTIREVLRQGLEHRPSPLTPDSIRQTIADELTRVLAGLELSASDPVHGLAQEDIERTYGDRLDRMLGKLSAGNPRDADDR